MSNDAIQIAEEYRVFFNRIPEHCSYHDALEDSQYYGHFCFGFTAVLFSKFKHQSLNFKTSMCSKYRL